LQAFIEKLELTSEVPEISKIQKITEKVGYSLKFEEEMKKEKAMSPHNSNNYHHSISILIERVCFSCRGYTRFQK
jgi:hypothetical protein